MNWSEILGAEKQQPYFTDLMRFITERRRSGIDVFPPDDKVFAAFELTSLEQTNVVILGQDPYHRTGQAHGLCFSIATPQRLPPSLRNIFAELEDDLSLSIDKDGNLSHWAKQGVLMLNTVLTVESGKPNSHKNLGWERFTDSVISGVSKHRRHVVFILWGSQAIKKSSLIDDRHTLICSPHPSPLSAHRGFFGSKPFSRTNHALQQHSQQQIDWKL